MLDEDIKSRYSQLQNGSVDLYPEVSIGTGTECTIWS
jgi:hypothetical protein